MQNNYEKNIEEDSSRFMKGKAMPGQWEPTASSKRGISLLSCRSNNERFRPVGCAGFHRYMDIISNFVQQFSQIPDLHDFGSSLLENRIYANLVWGARPSSEVLL